MASRDPDRPNILFVLTDDQGHWALGCAGNPEIRTPNLDRLAASGLRFEEFFCVSPVCSPARASILTGRIPSQHGVHDWLRAGNSTCEPDRDGELTEYLEGQTGYTELLAAAGYRCGLSGKWHLGDSHHAQKGFDFWEVHAKGGGPYYRAPMIRNGDVHEETRYVTDVITDNGLRFLDEVLDGSQPFYLGVNYTAPHSPWGRAEHPPDLYGEYFDNCPFTSFPEDPIHPWHLGSRPWVGDKPEERRGVLAGYCAATTAMDTGFGRLLDWLEQRGLRDNTLVIFTSDNGMNMGHHGIYGKGNGTFPQNMYDTSVKVPMLMSLPGRIPPNEVVDELLSHYDLMPTLLEFVGLDMPRDESLPGFSFAPLLRGKAGSSRDEVVVFDEYGPVRMIRTREWKYVHRYPYGPHELYNLQSDSGEKLNRIDDKTCCAVREQLKSRLESWFCRYVDPARDGTHEAVTGNGQLGLAGPAGEGRKTWSDDGWSYRYEELPPG